MTIYFLIFLHPLLNTFASHTQSLCRSDQRDALLELRKEFPKHYEDYGLAIPWNKSVDCCSWDGVMCDAILGEVISLQLCLSDISVNTSLKSSSGLFKLHHLTFLDLSRCRLHGKIPSSIGNLSHLTSLDLSQNQLVGEVPASISNLNKLDYINLGKNHLRGNILTSFGNFTELYKLNLRENQFTGGISVLANLTSLSEIDISLNHFKSSFPSYDRRHNHLFIFWGYGNSLSGPFPTSLLMQPFLDEIDLSGNQFEGSIDFENTSSSTMLRVLHVGYNNLDGLIPESISKLFLATTISEDKLLDLYQN
ncbi:PREDICTED: receptor like protein 30-like [Camelina sativa]|uniref:Receptor like protein 30-like n=1 Tax=Camelina sativa TaxID=90675 RepID=A0ABM0T5T8_CAMSA|nr:PREDICTED: receptor like protein 30-like [Camelina sativa]